MAEEEEQQEEQVDKNKRIRLRERACGQKNILTIDSAHQIFIPSYGPVDVYMYARLIVIIEFSKSSILIKFHFAPL